MSWKIFRQQKRPSHEQKRREQRKRHHAQQALPPDQKLINHLVFTEALVSVFGSSSVEYAWRVAVRLKRAKQRKPDIPESNSPVCQPAPRLRLSGRNRHHMTPRCRIGDIYYGDAIYNNLNTKITRHIAVHNEFGERTWEEIILLLWRAVRFLRSSLFRGQIEERHHQPKQKTPVLSSAPEQFRGSLSHMVK